MGKKLLTKKYGRIVLKGLLLPERDVIKYYTNIIVKHYPDNPDMFTELKNVLNGLIEWYKGQVRGGTVPTEMPDGTIKYFDRNQIWSGDGSGDYSKYVKHDLYEHEIFLFPINSERALKENVKVNKAYFENHLRIIEDIERKERLKKLEIGSYILERIKTNIDNLKNSTNPLITGFQSNLTDEQIQRLFELLKGSYIDINTNPGHFRAIFRSNPLPADYLPIKKTKQFTGTLLAYFISELFQKENQSDYWHIAGYCFDKAKNLKQSLKNAYDYNPDRKPKGYNEIDTILKSIYSPLQ